jgi:hypothetical protein
VGSAQGGGVGTAEDASVSREVDGVLDGVPVVLLRFAGSSWLQDH